MKASLNKTFFVKKYVHNLNNLTANLRNNHPYKEQILKRGNKYFKPIVKTNKEKNIYQRSRAFKPNN